MKNNNRNKKLSFIREKNNLRLGKRPFAIFAKISNELFNDEIALGQVIQKLVNDVCIKVKNKYKLFLRHVIIEFSCNSDDFIRDQQTIKVELTNQKPLI